MKAKNKILKQAISISLSELMDLRKSLFREAEEFNKGLGLNENDIDYDKKRLVGIINKTPECSDTWEIEQ